jgi:DNA-binding MarR family transcriptional regulator
MTEPALEQSVRNIVWAIRRIMGLIYTDSRRQMKRFGVTGPQSLVIKSLTAAEEDLSSAGLARMLGVTPPNMTGIIDRLEGRGLVERQRKEGDRRVSLIHLTKAGEQLSETLRDPVEEKLMVGLRDLPPTEVYGVYSALNSIIDILGKETVAQAPVDPDVGRMPETESGSKQDQQP